MPKSPALPWEVIERVIDHSAGRTRTLYSFTLACRDLRPRSTILLLGHVRLKSRDQLFDLCNVLQAKPHLRSCVRSVSIPAHEFSPHPLLRILPNLFEIDFTWTSKIESPLTFHPSVLTSCRQYGQHIQTLSLRLFQFSSISAFANILLSLPTIKSLSCEDLSVRNDGVHWQELTTRRLSGRLHLATLGIHGHVNNAILTLLREATKHRLTVLAHTDVDAYRADRAEVREHFVKLFLASPSDVNWIQLSSLTWKMPTLVYEDECKESIRQVISVLQNFRPPKLQEVTVVFPFRSLQWFLVKALPSASELCGELETTLTAFSRPIISFSPRPDPKIMISPPYYRHHHHHHHINGRRHHSWMHMIEKSFPVLAKRCALVLDAEPWYAGHDGEIWTPIVTSADSRWAATGSEDGTIIIWDLESGCISQEWFAEPNGVEALAFSPDGRYVMSASGKAAAESGTGATVWDLHGVCKVRSLMGEDVGDTYCRMHCAWSPDGSWIAAGPQADGAVYVWETTTFQRLHFWNAVAWKGRLLAFSADGCWVATADRSSGRRDEFDCCIWDVGSGKLHQSLRGHTDAVCAATFNLERTRVATGSDDSTTRIWDAETGAQLLVLKEQATRWIDAVAFSRDGRMVLSHSCNVEDHLGDDSKWTDDGSGGVKVWDASSGVLLASLLDTRADLGRIPYSPCFSPCGRYVAAASYNQEATLWRTSDWSCVAKVSGNGAQVTQVAISPDGKVLCWGTEVGTVFFRRMCDLV